MKGTTYLKYAVGEIFLVMVGILLALGINSWNENKKDRVSEARYLKNIERDLNDQIQHIDHILAGEGVIEMTLSKALNAYDPDKGFIINQQSLKSLVAVTDRFTFTPIDRTYRELTTSGKLDLIEDLALKELILGYYEQVHVTANILANNTRSKDLGLMPATLGLLELVGPQEVDLTKSSTPMLDSFEGYEVSPRTIRLIQQVLSTPSNELSLLNALRYRKLMASYHITNLNKLKSHSRRILETL